MNSHLEINDEDFEILFQKSSLPASLFTHEAHLRLAWIQINKYGTEEAIKNICEQLSNYVELIGAGDKYNKTLTIAAIKAVSHFNNKCKLNSFKNFIELFPRLKYNFKELMALHYQKDIYNSEQAKREYIEPDLLAFS